MELSCLVISYNEFNICIMYTPFVSFKDDPFVPEPRHEPHCDHPRRYNPTRHYPSPHCECHRMEPAEWKMTGLMAIYKLYLGMTYKFVKAAHKKMVWQGNDSLPASLAFVNGLCRVWHLCKPNRDGNCMVVSVSWNRRTLKWDIPEVQVEGKWQVIVVALISNSSNSSSIYGVIV